MITELWFWQRELRVNERTSSLARYDMQWLCEVAPSFVYQVTPHLQNTNTPNIITVSGFQLKSLFQYNTGTCTNLNKTCFLQKMMFFAIITSNIDLDRGVFVKIHAIYVPLIYDNCKAFIITEMQFLLFNTFLGGGGMGVKGCNGGGLIFWYEHILQQLQCARYEFWKWNDQIIKLNTPQHMDKQTRQNLNFSVQSYNICSHNFYYFNH